MAPDSPLSHIPQLPPGFAGWFRLRGWSPHEHQLAMLRAAEAGRNTLLIAPTGGGKTLAGFLPSLIDLAERPRPGLHTLYISPLKALAVDIHRNVEVPIAEMRLSIRAESRTGDTPTAKRQRQQKTPPQILMTTPESLALMIASKEAEKLFGGLACIIVDELHALTNNKRGELLSLGLARLSKLAPTARRVGLSATVAWPDALHAYLSPKADPADPMVERVIGRQEKRATIDILETDTRLPWSGHYALHAMVEVYERLREVQTAILFVNTRAQAELIFQELWRLNEDGLAI
ncbi:MAG: DEAD/DEAH box helicase, partial [Pseudomonadota bacterium]